METLDNREDGWRLEKEVIGRSGGCGWTAVAIGEDGWRLEIEDGWSNWNLEKKKRSRVCSEEKSRLFCSVILLPLGTSNNITVLLMSIKFVSSL